MCRRCSVYIVAALGRRARENGDRGLAVSGSRRHAAAALALAVAALGGPMQRTAAEQATPHGAPLPELPPELVVSIVRAGKSISPASLFRKHGLILVKMLQVCKAWRRALTAELANLWREVALAQYPRLHDVLAMAGTRPEPLCFRSLYRSQLDADRRPLRTGLHAYALTVELHAMRQAGPIKKLVARASVRMDRMITFDNEGLGRLHGDVVLTMEPAYKEGLRLVDMGNHASFEDFVRKCCSFRLYATRLSDLKTANIVTIRELASDGVFDRHREECGARCILYDFHVMAQGMSIFDQHDAEANEPGVYASFDPVQKKFYIDFWERYRGDFDDPLHSINQGGDGPAGEMYMAEVELQDYLGFHARWT